jgi:hypothetical protein
VRIFVALPFAYLRRRVDPDWPKGGMMDRLQASINGTNRQEPTQEMVGFQTTLLARLLRRTDLRLSRWSIPW